MYQQLIDDFVKQESLPVTYQQDALAWFVPLLSELDALISGAADLPIIIGINGAQGTGKSTLAKLLTRLLQQQGRKVATLSIDDFYYSKAKRAELASRVHPLLASRGVPGTHDTELALRIVDELRGAKQNDRVRLPAFDKARDDCVAIDLCPSIEGPVDVIILEGWFIGAKPQPDSELSIPLNELESVDDADESWRRYVNHQLAQGYQQLFSRIQLLIMLQAPKFEQVYAWRRLQEQKLRRQDSKGMSDVMNDEQLDYFIQHFERLTRHCLATLPKYADIVFQLDVNHRVAARLNPTADKA